MFISVSQQSKGVHTRLARKDSFQHRYSERERGVPESSIISLIVNKPSMMILKQDKFGACVDRAAELGLAPSKVVFVRALQAFGRLSESTVKHKMDVYRRCGWSECDLNAAFLRHPLCLKLSQKKIRRNMDFLVKEMRMKASEVAQCPSVLDYNCDTRMRPRWMVVRVLKARGLMKESRSITSLFHTMSEANFFNRYIAHHHKEFPELLDIYRGSNVISKST
ncbi:uncharacterized protein LOC130988197 [Salvia miltiorrhiza]|uniref:uncharacterized protein LOC130988197 n=1 Tax=Salvia miltiorrhiza TaxID=226208 RepID=UPI0025ABFB0A|nr:uncharacterized protein LOC130988197 [Salvia miltiorrhiza]